MFIKKWLEPSPLAAAENFAAIVSIRLNRAAPRRGGSPSPGHGGGHPTISVCMRSIVCRFLLHLCIFRVMIFSLTKSPEMTPEHRGRIHGFPA